MMDGALFDFDGTLMDTEPAIMESYKEIFRRYGKEEDFDEEKQVAVLGPSLESMMKKYFPEQDAMKLVQEYREYQSAHILEWIHPMPHALDLLEYLYEQDIPMGLVSTRYRSSMEKQLKLFHMEKYFGALIGHDEVTKEKPDPEGIRKGCEILNLPQDAKILFVGDSPTDIGAGKNAGAYTVAIVSTERKRDKLKASGPDAMINDLGELVELLQNQPI